MATLTKPQVPKAQQKVTVATQVTNLTQTQNNITAGFITQGQVNLIVSNVIEALRAGE